MDSSELTLQIGRMQGQMEMLTLLVVILLAANAALVAWLLIRRRDNSTEHAVPAPVPQATDGVQGDVLREAEHLLLRQGEPSPAILGDLQKLAVQGDEYIALLHRFLEGGWREDASLAEALSTELLARFEEKGAHPWTNLMIADIAMFRQQADLAAEHIRLALEQRGREAAIWQRMGEAHLMRDEADHAIDCLQKAVELEMKRSAAWLQMGWAELLAHRPDMVDQHLKFAYDFAESAEEQQVQRRANMVSTLGKAALGDEGEAVTLLDVLLDLHRNEATAREMLASLEKVAPLYAEQGSVFLKLRSHLMKHMEQQGFE